MSIKIVFQCVMCSKHKGGSSMSTAHNSFIIYLRYGLNLSTYDFSSGGWDEMRITEQGTQMFLRKLQSCVERSWETRMADLYWGKNVTRRERQRGTVSEAGA